MAQMLRFEAAWARALGTAGLVPSARAEDTADAIAGFMPDMDALARSTAIDGLPIPGLIQQLKTAIGAEGVHQGATSQDVIDTAMVFAVLGTIDRLSARLHSLIAAIGDLNAQHGAQPLMGRTRMQAATPITVADRTATWVFPHHTHLARLNDVKERIAHLQIGGASGDRGALAEDAGAIIAAMSAELGLPAGEKAWHAMRDGVAEFASVLSLITGTLGKMGQDIALMAQQGISEITLSVGGGSSAMPHKQNPIQAELLVTLARFNAVQVGGMHQALIHEQERSGAAWALEWMILPQMAKATGRALVVAESLIQSVVAIGTAD